MFGFTPDELEPAEKPDRQSDENAVAVVILANLLAFALLAYLSG